ERVDRVGVKTRTELLRLWVFLLPLVVQLVLQRPLKADAVVEQVVALGLRRKIPAADQLAAAGWPPLLGQELLEIGVLVGIVHVAGNRRAIVVRSARGVGHEVLPPAIKYLPPRIGEAVGDEHVELSGPRLIAKDAGVRAPLGTPGRFDLRMVERPFVE